MIGARFGHWIVIDHSDKRTASGGLMFKCQCNCGLIRDVSKYNLLTNRSTSCGCNRSHLMRVLLLRKGDKHHLFKHGHTSSKYQIRSREYSSWSAMKQRCYNPKATHYSLYGAKGIKVCKRWLNSFELFLKDMGNRPVNTTLDRVDSKGNYEPSNCRWADPVTQSRNRFG